MRPIAAAIAARLAAHAACAGLLLAVSACAPDGARAHRGALDLSIASAADGAADGEGEGEGEGGVPRGGAERDGPFWHQQHELATADAEDSNRVGWSVAIDGDTALVGAPGNAGSLIPPSKVYVLLRDGPYWVMQAKLEPESGHKGVQFGWSVALSGDSAVVGARSDDSNGPAAGAAHVFERSAGSWEEKAKLLPADGAPSAELGHAVAVAGTTLVVGAPGDAELGSEAGAAYVYVRAGGVWQQQAKLLASDGQADDQFGQAVAIDGDTVVVGALGYNFGGLTNAGAAYVFTRSAGVWTQQQLLPSPNANLFGHAVALAGDTALVAAPSVALAIGNSSVSVFVRSAGVWTEQATLSPDDTPAEGNFGTAVALSGERALIGAPCDMSAGPDTGAAYVYERTGADWNERAKIIAADEAQQDQFGAAVALAGGTAAVGAPYDWENGKQSGSAYVFDLVGELCSNGSECPSGFCVDGLCCNGPCGGGKVGDCVTCTKSLAGPMGRDGLCMVLPNGEACDDGTYCNGTETCVAGVCAGSEGNPCPDFGDGDDDCAEACDENIDACVKPEPDGTACADGGSCIGGACLAPPGVACDEGGTCLTDHCLDGVCCEAEDCGAYRCGTDGSCHQICTSAADCAEGYECTADGRCIAPVAASADDGGCGCRVVSRQRSIGAAVWMLGWALLASRYRRKAKA